VPRPTRDDAAEYYFTYIDKVGEGNIVDILRQQQAEIDGFLATITEAESTTRSKPEQWTPRQVLNHINDGERLFVSRALWFARVLEGELPGFDQNIAVDHALADRFTWKAHLTELKTIRASSITFFENLTEESWQRRGIASGYNFTVNALAYIVAGHFEHHLRKLKERFPRT
jgi:hypothetical protein